MYPFNQLFVFSLLFGGYACIVPKGRSWIVKRSYEDFRVLDKHLHLCIYDRRFSQLPELPRLDSLTDQSEVLEHPGTVSKISALF